MTTVMDDATIKAASQIEKLMRHAGGTSNPQEAAVFIAKAQALLAAYNLDMTTVEAVSGETTKRTDENLSGGGYKYQQRLWRHIAELNFCMYWTMKVRVKPGSYAEKRKRTFTAEHRLVGRVINVQQTKNMAGYLHQTIERLRREALGSDTRSRDAMAFREGVSDAVIEKIIDRREKAILDEKREAAKAAERAAAAGTSMATAMTLGTVKQRESDANYDFLHGDGAAAKRRKRLADAEQAQAQAEAEEEKFWAEWATAHPEQAKKEAAEEAKRDRAREKRQARSGSGYGRYRFRETAEEMRRDSGSYLRGVAAGKSVSIDPQAEAKTVRRIGR